MQKSIQSFWKIIPIDFTPIITIVKGEFSEILQGPGNSCDTWHQTHKKASLRQTNTQRIGVGFLSVNIGAQHISLRVTRNWSRDEAEREAVPERPVSLVTSEKMCDTGRVGNYQNECIWLQISIPGQSFPLVQVKVPQKCTLLRAERNRIKWRCACWLHVPQILHFLPSHFWGIFFSSSFSGIKKQLITDVPADLL